jgi:putative tricarboxylic transport membrane protein
MRRDTFLKSLAALAAAGAWPSAQAAGVPMKMMIPANPGGGWDTTGRAFGKALQDAGRTALVLVLHGAGQAGVLQGLAEGAPGGVPAAAGVGGDHHLHGHAGRLGRGPGASGG